MCIRIPQQLPAPDRRGARGASLALQRLCLGLALVLAAGAQAQAPAPWPEVALPAQATSYRVGRQLEINGLPMRLTGFVSNAGVQQTAAWFRRTLGPALVENRVGRKQILGRAQGEYYITVQIEAASGAAGSRGMVAVAQRGALQQTKNTQEALDRWRRLLPAGTQITSHLRAQENGTLSTHLVAHNRHGAQLNAQRLAAAMQAQGYELERSLAPGRDGVMRVSGQMAGAATLLFRGPGKQAMAVIAHDAQQGQTSIVLVTGVQMQAMR